MTITPERTPEDESNLTQSIEIKLPSVSGEETSVRVVDIQHRPGNYGLESLAEWEENSDEENNEFCELSVATSPQATTSPYKEISPSTSSLLRSQTSSSLGTSSLNASVTALQARRKGQRHVYRSVKSISLIKSQAMDPEERKRQLAGFREAQEIQQQISLVERQYDDLEEAGKQLEQAIRNVSDDREIRLNLKIYFTLINLPIFCFHNNSGKRGRTYAKMVRVDS